MANKKTVTITLQVKEIVFDIQNKTYLTGRSRQADTTKGYEAAAHMQASDDQENDYQIRRSVSDAFCDLESEFSRYITKEAGASTNLVNETVDNDGALEMQLKLPCNFQDAAASNLASCMHQYIVNRAIAQWFAITNKVDSEEYDKAADEALTVARRSVSRRSQPTRPLYP